MEAFKVIAPTRADLAGGTLDIWPIYNILGGCRTINVALDLFASATFEVSPASSFKMEIVSLGGETYVLESPLDPDSARRLSPAVQFPVMVVSSYLARHPRPPQKFIRLRLETSAPLRSGLGGSSTLCVAMARGLGRVFHEFVEQGWQWNLLHWVKDVEAAYLKTTTGVQDYLAALFGGARCYHYEMGSMGTHAYSENVFQGLSDRLIVLFSGEMHSSGLTNWELYKALLEGNKEVTQGFVSIKKIAESLDHELRLPTPDWVRVGHWLNEEWEVRREIFKVETKRIDEITKFLTSQRVLGRKVCGAAAGGSLIALVEPARKTEIMRACEEAGIQVLQTSPTMTGVTITESSSGLWSRS